MSKIRKKLEKIWWEVPVDYYQKGVTGNILQRLWHRGRLKSVLEMMGDLKFKGKETKILDTGCASGWFISEVARRFPQYNFFGVDIYEKAIEQARKYYPGISFSCVDAHHLSFPDNSFNMVICMNVLEHVVNPQQILKEIKRVIKSGGKVIIGMDSENFLFSMSWYLWKKFSGKVWKDAHLHKLKPKDLEELFLKTGLKIQKRKFFNFGMAVIFLLKT